MNAQRHLIFGLFLAIILIWLLGLVENLFENVLSMLLIIGTVLLGSIFPDIDHNSSKITKLMNKIIFVLIIGLAVVLYLMFALPFELHIFAVVLLSAVGCYYIIKFIINRYRPPHRGITHKIWFNLVLVGILLVVCHYFSLGWYIPLAFGVGLASHLFLDAV